jgi:PAS domain S-box-containing protein
MSNFNELNSLSEKVMIDNLMDNFQVTSYNENEKIEQNDLLNQSVNRKKPFPVDKEINLDPTKTIMSKTDTRGIIEYANEYFMEISGYEEFELMGRPHNIIRHPDMPKTIFKLMWDSIEKGQNIHAFVKNMAKDGRYYWVLTNFEIKKDAEGNVISYYARRKAAPRNAIYEIDRLYYILKSIENKQDMQTALNYFIGMLEEKNMTYNQFILSILEVNQQQLSEYFSDQKFVPQAIEERKKGVLGRLFS